MKLYIIAIKESYSVFEGGVEENLGDFLDAFYDLIILADSEDEAREQLKSHKEALNKKLSLKRNFNIIDCEEFEMKETAHVVCERWKR